MTLIFGQYNRAKILKGYKNNVQLSKEPRGKLRRIMTKSILQLAQKTRSRCFTSDNRENNRLIVEDSSARRL